MFVYVMWMYDVMQCKWLTVLADSLREEEGDGKMI